MIQTKDVHLHQFSVKVCWSWKWIYLGTFEQWRRWDLQQFSCRNSLPIRGDIISNQFLIFCKTLAIYVRCSVACLMHWNSHGRSTDEYKFTKVENYFNTVLIELCSTFSHTRRSPAEGKHVIRRNDRKCYSNECLRVQTRENENEIQSEKWSGEM